MKFQYTIQKYQTDAVEAVVKVFDGQGKHKSASYLRDVGVFDYTHNQTTIEGYDEVDQYSDIGYKNADVDIKNDDLLNNIQNIQKDNNIQISSDLVKDLGSCSLDIDMETGTGKTYVYIKTIFELNKHYGWSKYIVVVPSIAIREGVRKSFETTSDHFMEHYGKRARFFVYNSSQLHELDDFSSNNGINVMIINSQAFNASFDEEKNIEGKKGDAAARIIFTPRDTFGSRRPIDVIAANKPIIILDEPQKLGGDKTQEALKKFNPLFSLNYSATHKNKHNMVYVLDALEAFNQKLVKKIQVKGFEIQNLLGTNGYLYLHDIVLSHNAPPKAKFEFEKKLASGMIKKETKNFDVGDNLFIASNEMEQYKDYVISEINPSYGTVTFTNGIVVFSGNNIGDITEKDLRRIQIRETIRSHFEKEERLFNQGIKTLSLFFIDEVAKYRMYGENGEELPGEYASIFEEEYRAILNEYLTLEDSDYQRYLKSTCSEPSLVHNGYFSIDKKSKHFVDDVDNNGKAKKLNKKSDISDDTSAYDLILKNKEALLSFEEPTRFIFSHSALREGWDNPNIFQICTLKSSASKTTKRQEVGRGLRLCVDQTGSRMDYSSCGESFYKINLLTVIASDSYKSFVKDLQSDIKDELYERPSKATKEYFSGKMVSIGVEKHKITIEEAGQIEFYLIHNQYVDIDRNITDKYREDVRNESLVPLPTGLAEMSEDIHKLVQAIFDEKILNEMISNAHEPKIMTNPLNDNFKKKEFINLWNCINHKYAYRVEFQSEELIKNAIDSINKKLFVSELKYVTTTGEQKDAMDQYEIERGDTFDTKKTKTEKLEHVAASTVKYDLVGKIAKGTVLTRKTVAAILSGIEPKKQYMFKANPEEFISNVIQLINEQKATMVIDCISYNTADGTYDSSIFTANSHSQESSKAFKATKHIQDYVFTDGIAENSVEKRFAKDLDNAEEVCVYAKLPSGPRGYQIPTPVGNYSPDWAIAFNEGLVKHVFFIAETKGTMDSLNLRAIEKAKIDCARKLFENISTGNVKYEVVKDYQTLWDIIHNE